MNNIWKYTLTFCFTIIIDQLIKGSIQGFVEVGKQIEILPMIFFSESHFMIISSPWNKVLAYLSLFTMFYMVKNVVIYRNKSFFLGLMRTFLMIGLFTIFLDLLSTGYIVNYINVANLFSLSIGKIYLVIGFLSLTVAQMITYRKNK